MRVPPVINCERPPEGGEGPAGPAFLSAWVRRPDGSWWARVLWIEQGEGDGQEHGEGYGEITRHTALIPARCAHEIGGQDYKRVPRYTLDARRHRPPCSWRCSRNLTPQLRDTAIYPPG